MKTEVKEKNKNHLTIEWWESLPEFWKHILLREIGIFKKGKYSLKNITIFEKFKRLLGYDRKENLNYDTQEALININKLNDFAIDDFVDEFQNKKLDLSPISKLTNLTSFSLTVYNTNVDISPIFKLTNLTSLYLYIYTGFNNDLSLISKLTKLEILDLQIFIKDLSPISKLPNLTCLKVHDISGDLNQISSFTNLSCLTIRLNTSDLSPLSDLINLKHLGLIDNEADLSPISKLPNLTSLTLGNFYSKEFIPDLSPISELTKLTSLVLDFHKIKVDLSPISKLTNLRSLTIINVRSDLSDLNPIEDLIKRIKSSGGEVNISK
jgi:Leucine-rich repeat (LRR) protein